MKQALQSGVPMNAHLGIEIVEMEPGRGVARLPDRPELKNHVGSQHAAALFAVAEAASGAGVVAAFASRMAEVTPLAQAAEIRYARIARGPITATSSVAVALADVSAELDANGRVAFDVDVDLTNEEGESVATMTVKWHLRKRAAPASA
jgi:acyl-coenzyme A thioesterase PaaI-like protein